MGQLIISYDFHNISKEGIHLNSIDFIIKKETPDSNYADPSGIDSDVIDALTQCSS